MIKHFLRKNWIALLCILLAGAMMVLGLRQGDYQTTRRKGSMICTQCVGFK